MDSDKMRAEFEAWATVNARELDTCLVMCKGEFVYTYQAELAFKIYAAGRKAEQAEVERLRAACNKYSEDELLQGDWKARALKAEAELAAARNQNRNDTEAITEQALRVLDSSEVDGDSDSVPPTVLELVELMADAAVMAREERNLWHSAAQRLQAELAAAKAASVVPVQVDNSCQLKNDC